MCGGACGKCSRSKSSLPSMHWHFDLVTNIQFSMCQHTHFDWHTHFEFQSDGHQTSVMFKGVHQPIIFQEIPHANLSLLFLVIFQADFMGGVYLPLGYVIDQSDDQLPYTNLKEPAQSQDGMTNYRMAGLQSTPLQSGFFPRMS